MSQDLEQLRKQLDSVDAALVAALAQREGLIGEIARAKLDDSGSLRDVKREEDLLGRVVEQARGAGLDGFFVTRLFREIMDHSLRVQQERLLSRSNPQRGAQRLVLVGFQGTEGSYSQLAASKHFSSFPGDVVLKGFDSFRDMLEAVHDGAADYAMLPIENTTAGSINEAYDLLAKMNLHLVGEEVQRVDHCLLALEPVPLANIRRVYSQLPALTQCSEFLRTLSHVHVESYADTAMAAAKVRDDQDLSQAAIASEEAGRIFGLHVIKRDIANSRENYTRMVAVARTPVAVEPRMPCKTSLIFATRHEEGALLNCLNIFHNHKLNLTKLESRPRLNTPWEYLFYVDFEGNVADDTAAAALRELAGRTSYLRVLGSYPARTTRDAAPAEPRRPAPPQPATANGPGAANGAGGTAAPPVTKAPPQTLEKSGLKLVSRAGRAEDTQIRVGNVIFGGPKPVIIAGPCSVESRDQIMISAKIVKEHGGHVLRGGCFKPRTSPYAFQGLGYEGLDMLAEAGKTFGLPIITEVLHPADIEKVAQKADILQLGARNMQNFALLKEIGRVDRPVMLKRGLMASIDEWLGAAEYILAHGNQQVILCERGIRTFETATRNTLDISAVPVVRERTHLPIVIDPSHACGVARWVAPLAEAALACGAHGLMIEIHPDPEKALSDGPQSLRFEAYAEMMRRLARTL